MSTKPRGMRSAGGIGYALLLIGALVGILYFAGFGFQLSSLVYPSYVQYNAAGSMHTLKTVGTNGMLSTMTLTGGSASWPIGSGTQQFSITSPSGQLMGTWTVALPADQSVGPSSSYGFTPSFSGSALLSSSTNPALWNVEGPALQNQNPYIIKNNFTSSLSSPAVPSAPSNCYGFATGAFPGTSCRVTWWINRYYFTVNLQTAGAGLYIACATTCYGYTSILGWSNAAAYDQAFAQGVQTSINTINGVTKLTAPTDLSIQLNIPPLPGGQSNTDYSGIIDAFTAIPCTGTASTGIAIGSLCATSCGGASSCSIVQSNTHTALPLFKDSGQAMLYTPQLGPFFGVANYTATQLASITPSTLLAQAYTKIDLASFGAGFTPQSQQQGCGIGNFAACWTVTAPQTVMTIVFDVLTSYHVISAYPTPYPQTGPNAGALDGQVVDGSLLWKPGVAGASICLTDISGCTGADSNGNFVLSNIPAGTHTIQITAPTFFGSGPITVQIGTGTTYHLGQISLAPQNPWYLGNYCPVPPAYPGGFQICIPWLLIFGIIGAIIVIAVVAIFAYRRPVGVAAGLVERVR